MSPSHEEFKHKFPVPRNEFSALEGDSADSGCSDDKDKNELEAQVAEESDKSSQSSMSPQGACSDGGKSSSTLPSTDDPWVVNDPWSVGAKANKVAPPPNPAATRSNPKAKAPPPPPPPMASIAFAKKPDEDDDVQGADVTLNQTPTIAPGLPPPGIAVETGRGMISGSPYIGGGAGGSAATSTQHAEEFVLEDAQWPNERTTVLDLMRGGTKYEQWLLESLCLYIIFQPHINMRNEVCDLLAKRLMVQVHNVHGTRNGGWIVGFSTPEDVSKVYRAGSSRALEDVVQRMRPFKYITSRTNPHSRVWFFNYLMEKFTLDKLQQRLKKYGDVLDVHPVNYHDVTTQEVVMNGWVDFSDPSSVDRLWQDIEQDTDKYEPTLTTYTVVRFANTKVGISKDRGADTDANLRTSSAAPAAAAAPAEVPAAAAAVAAAQAEPPYTRPQREMGRPSASEMAAELDLAIPGLGEVATKAKVLHFLNSPEYVNQVLAWIAEHELAELEELAEAVEKVTGFAGMKELCSKRFLRELRAAVPVVADGR